MVGAPEFEVIKFVSFGHLCRAYHNRLTAIRKTETSIFYVKPDLNTDIPSISPEVCISHCGDYIIST